MQLLDTHRSGTVAEMTALIDAYLRHAKARGHSRQTLKDREKLLRRLDRDLPMGLCEATVEELEDFLAGPSTQDRIEWAAETRATYYSTIKGFFRWACNPTNPKLDYDPTASLSRPPVPPGVPKPATEEQVQRGLQLPHPWNVCVGLAAYGSARCIEIARLDRADITADWTRLFGKGGKVRELPTHPVVWGMVQELPPGPLVTRTTEPDKPVDGEYVAWRSRQVLHANGLPISLHWYRHRFATMTLRPRHYGGAGASLRAVQELMGHASPRSTARYTAVSEGERRDAIAALPSYSPTPS